MNYLILLKYLLGLLCFPVAFIEVLPGKTKQVLENKIEDFLNAKKLLLYSVIIFVLIWLFLLFAGYVASSFFIVVVSFVIIFGLNFIQTKPLGFFTEHWLLLISLTFFCGILPYLLGYFITDVTTINPLLKPLNYFILFCKINHLNFVPDFEINKFISQYNSVIAYCDWKGVKDYYTIDVYEALNKRYRKT